MGNTTRHGVPLLVGNAIADFQQIDDALNHFDGTAALQSDLLDHEAAVNAHGATGAVVGTTNTQTLTAKTLTAPIITGTVAGGASYTAPTITGPTITGTVAGGAIYTAPHLTSVVVDTGGLVITAGGATITGGIGLGVAIGGGWGHPGSLFFPVGPGDKIVFEADSVSTGFGIGLNTGEVCLFSGNAFTFRIGSLSGTVLTTINSSGAIVTAGGYGANNAAASNAFTAPNVANATGQGMAQSWLTYSSVDHARALKLTIEPITDAMAKVRALEAVYYQHTHFKPDLVTPLRHKGRVVSTPTYGFAASDVKDVLPELAHDGPDGKPLAVDLARMVPVLWEALKDVDRRLQQMEAR